MLGPRDVQMGRLTACPQGIERAGIRPRDRVVVYKHGTNREQEEPKWTSTITAKRELTAGDEAAEGAPLLRASLEAVEVTLELGFDRCVGVCGQNKWDGGVRTTDCKGQVPHPGEVLLWNRWSCPVRISSDMGLDRDKGGFAGHLSTEGLLSQAGDIETSGAGETEMAKNKLPAFPVCFSFSDNSQPHCRLGGGGGGRSAEIQACHLQ